MTKDKNMTRDQATSTRHAEDRRLSGILAKATKTAPAATNRPAPGKGRPWDN